MIKATIHQLKELLDLNLKQIHTLKLLEKLQKEKARTRRLVKNNPVVGYDKDGEPITQAEIDTLKELIDSFGSDVTKIDR